MSPRSYYRCKNCDATGPAKPTRKEARKAFCKPKHAPKRVKVRWVVVAPPVEHAVCRCTPAPAIRPDVVAEICAAYRVLRDEEPAGIAMDSDGEWFVYGDKPIRRHERWLANRFLQILSPDRFGLPHPGNLDWRESWTPNPALAERESVSAAGDCGMTFTINQD